MTPYEQGYKDGLYACAINRDGEQWVGSPEKKVGDVVSRMKSMWNYLPPNDPSEELIENLKLAIMWLRTQVAPDRNSEAQIKKWEEIIAKAEAA